MLRKLNDLDGGIIPNLGRVVGGQRDLRQAKGAAVLLVRGPGDLEDGQHRVRVVEGLVAVAHVDVDLGERVAGEPAGLDRHSTAFQRPFCAVPRRGHAAACKVFVSAICA